MAIKEDYEIVTQTSPELAHRLFERAFERNKTRLLNAVISENVSLIGRLLMLETKHYFKEAADRIQDTKKENEDVG